MTGSRLAVVADDQRLASTVQSHLDKTGDYGSFVCGFSTIRDHLHRDADGILLLAASSSVEAELVFRLVQEIYLGAS